MSYHLDRYGPPYHWQPRPRRPRLGRALAQAAGLLALALALAGLVLLHNLA